MTVAEYAELPADDEIRYELQEGMLVMSPSPVPDHQLCLRRLARQLEDQLPDHLELIPDVDVDLQLVEPTQPGFVRRPDLVVVTQTALQRVRQEHGLLRASEVVLAVEIMSAGSRRTDRVVKHGEYADAGIPHYWIIDLRDNPQLTACHLAGEFGYVAAAPVEGTFTTTEPFAIQLMLDVLL